MRLLCDLSYAVRALRKSPGFVVVTVLTLALGVGANASIYSLVDTLAFRMFPPVVKEPERIVWMFETTGEGVDAFREEVAPANFADWKSQSQTLEAITSLGMAPFTITGNGEPERVKGYTVSSDYFKVMGVGVARGRTFTSDDEREGNEHVVILGDGFYKRRFGADPNLLERPISLDGKSYRVIGILPPEYDFPRHCNFLVPLALSAKDWQNRASGSFAAVARLAPGSTIAAAHAELDAISRRLGELYPSTNRSLHVRLVPVERLFVERGPLIALLSAVGFILLIACANVANLKLARGTERKRELAVRQALGASRFDLLRLLFAESILIALAGGVLGIGLAHEAIRWLVAYLPENVTGHLPWVLKMGVNRPVLVFALVATTLAALLSGLAPALRASRLDPQEALKDGAPTGATSSRRRTLASVLVIVQVALALALLAGSGVTTQSFLVMEKSPLGLRPDGVTAMSLPLDKRRYRDDAARARRIDELVRGIGALPGARQVAATSDVPLLAAGVSGFQVAGRPPLLRADLPSAHTYAVTSDFFATLGIPVLRGRLFERSDTENSAPVVVISDSIAHRLFPGEDPLGSLIRFEWDEEEGRPAREIVGIVGALHEPRLGSHAAGDIYFPFAQESTPNVSLLIHGKPADQLLVAARKLIRDSDPNQVIEHVESLEQIIRETRGGARVLVSLMAIMAALALGLATLGIYGLVSYTVHRRTREVGIRMALGAPRVAVVRFVVRHALLLTGTGIVIGLSISVPLLRALVDVLFLGSSARKLSPPELSMWLPLAAVAALLSLVAVLASLLPARRATKVDPMIALRSE